MNADPHYREAAGAIAGMTETYGWSPRPGDRVRCQLPFTSTTAEGVVVEVRPACVVVHIYGHHLWYFAHELEYVGREEG
jgi:hypothetical protein